MTPLLAGSRLRGLAGLVGDPLRLHLGRHRAGQPVERGLVRRLGGDHLRFERAYVGSRRAGLGACLGHRVIRLGRRCGQQQGGRNKAHEGSTLPRTTTHHERSIGAEGPTLDRGERSQEVASGYRSTSREPKTMGDGPLGACPQVGDPPLRGLRRGECCRRRAHGPGPGHLVPRRGRATRHRRGRLRGRDRLHHCDRAAAGRPRPPGRSAAAHRGGPARPRRRARTGSCGCAFATWTAAWSSPTTDPGSWTPPRPTRSRPPRVRSSPSSPASTRTPTTPDRSALQVVEVYRPLVAGPGPHPSRCARDLPALRADPRRHRGGAAQPVRRSRGRPARALRPPCRSEPRDDPQAASARQDECLPRGVRPAHRPAEPPRVRPTSRRAHPGRVGRLRGRRADRPRPVQGRQRLARAPERRRAADPDRPPPERRAPPG